MEAVLLIPDLKTMVKLTLVLIFGRFYINDYSQGKIIFEIQIIMVFNAVLKNIHIFFFFQVSERKRGDFRFWIESDAWRVSFCFRSLYIAAIL